MSLKKGIKVKTTFDEYTLVKQIGSGGNGRVFSATNSEGNLMALKFVERNVSSDKLKRFKNEINFCEKYSHKNIVKILDRGHTCVSETDYVFYVMDLYSETLRDRIKRGIPHEQIVKIFVGLMEGLQFAHMHNAIHRDIKPENIMFAEGSDEPIICDFGIAHFADEDLLTIIETKMSDRMANFQYAAPEQRVKGGTILPQTDIYAAGLILNEMFTGDIPQAQGYKTIASIDEEYKYLDEVFDLLFKQDAKERLYPEDKIISEIKVLAEKYKRDQEKAYLQSVVNELVDPEEFVATIVKKEYRNGKLIFVFDKDLPKEWYNYIAHGTYPGSFQWGYENDKLQKVSSNELGMPLRGNESERTLKDMVNNVQEWVKTTNYAYTSDLKRKARQEQQRKEQLRKAEIERLEKENVISSIVANL